MGYPLLKRCFDASLSALALAVLSPVVLVACLLIKLDSPGPAVYVGERVGRGGKRFHIFKLRTMVAGADATGPALSSAMDPRVTRVGAILRRSKLDELPQLLNVLKGDMSLVGPRPEDPRYVDLTSDDYQRLLSVRPGLTSPASIRFVNEAELLGDGGLTAEADLDTTYRQVIQPAKLAMELKYLERQSFWSDIAVLAQTAGLGFPRKLLRLSWLSTLIRRYVPWGLIDVAIVAVAFYGAFLFRFFGTPRSEFASALSALNLFMPLLLLLYSAMNYFWGLHRRAWRYATAREVFPILLAVVSSTVLVVAVEFEAGSRLPPPPLSIVLLGGFFSFCGFVFARYRRHLLGGIARGVPHSPAPSMRRVLIYGAGNSGQLLARGLRTQEEGRDYHVVGFLDDHPSKWNMRIHGIRVLGGRAQCVELIQRERIDLVILAMDVKGHKLRKLLSVIQATPVQVRIAPQNLEWISAASGISLLREVTVEDLLGRQTAVMDRSLCQNIITNRVVLVTGASGSIGAELCRQIAALSPRKLIALDNNETGLHELGLEISGQRGFKMQLAIADVTNDAKMDQVFAQERPDLVFHVAAYKHVPLMEHHPDEALRVNVGGTQVTLEKACAYGVERFVYVSTDKAVNPSSVMGATKRLAEVLVTGRVGPHDRNGHLRPVPRPLCTAVRFGNVLGSRGSVVPTFAKQIELGGPVTVTHPEMTRYFMGLGEAASLIIQAASLTTGGDIFMLDMGERIQIDELARKMIRLRGLRPDIDVPIVYTGIRPGEKLHEELAYDKEQKSATDRPRIYRLEGNGKAHYESTKSSIGTLLRMVGRASNEQMVTELFRISQQPNDKVAEVVGSDRSIFA